MNVYATRFLARCPVNNDLVDYTLRIETSAVVMAEQITDAIGRMDNKLHEKIADELVDLFHGKQTLTAEHRGVHIETTRVK